MTITVVSNAYLFYVSLAGHGLEEAGLGLERAGLSTAGLDYKTGQNLLTVDYGTVYCT